MNAVDRCNLIDVPPEAQRYYIHGGYLNGNADGLEGKHLRTLAPKGTLLYRAYLAGWLAGLKTKVDEQLDQIGEIMTKYYAKHLHRLRHEAQTRFDELMRALDTGGRRGTDILQVDGMQIRLAVDDFKVILTEIRKLK
jgi:hypothetical protein